MFWLLVVLAAVGALNLIIIIAFGALYALHIWKERSRRISARQLERWPVREKQP